MMSLPIRQKAIANVRKAKYDEDSSSESSEDEIDSNEDSSMTAPVIKKKKSKKEKKPSSKTQKAVKTKKTKQEKFTPTFEGWESNNQLATKDIDFSQWQTAHPARETFFIGPDNYIYHNSGAMKKFVDAINKKQVDDDAISIPITPMSKVIATNPRLTLGVTGSRYVGQNAGYRVSPIFYIGKEYVSCI